MPQFALTTDGNHPTQSATYLLAAALYADLSGHNVRKISYVPKGLDATIASALRREVQNFKDRVLSNHRQVVKTTRSPKIGQSALHQFATMVLPDLDPRKQS